MSKPKKDDRISMKHWPVEDRPREKLMDKGPSELTEAELLAIILGSGSREKSALELAKLILSNANFDLNRLSQYNVADLTRFKGVGKAKAVSVVATLELGRRKRILKREAQRRITTSGDAHDEMESRFQDLQYEEFWILLLNRSNVPIRKYLISRGGIAGTVADHRIIFKLAIENLASGIILAHNHPSGSAKPSESDKRITEKLKETGKLLDIPVLDHIIVTDYTYFSFADEGLL